MDKCTSCGKEFVYHLGIIGTCAEAAKWRGIAGRLAVKADHFLKAVRATHPVPFEDWADEAKAIEEAISELDREATWKKV